MFVVRIVIMALLIVLSSAAVAATIPTTLNLSPQRQQFIEKLLPIIHQLNQHIAMQRARLLRVHTRFQRHQPLNAFDQSWLMNLAREYRVKPNFDNTKTWELLQKRVDMLPPSLVLAQAINESGWGSSRFAKQGNNYFGQWCYKQGCGIVPAQRSAGATHEVKVFHSPSQSVQQYFRNLNTNKAYLPLRDERMQARQNGAALNGVQLAKGLVNYSQRRQAYITSIQTLITRFKLHQFDSNMPSLKIASSHLFPLFH